MKHSMKKLNRFLISLLIAAVLFSFAGCAGKETLTDTAADNAESSVTEAAEPETNAGSGPVISETADGLILRDCIGREVTVPNDPQRIAVLDSFAGEAVIMTGAGSLMVTCPGGVKSDSILQSMCPGLSDMPVVMSSGSFNAESLLELKPDVILVKQGVYETEEERLKLDKLQIPYLVICYTNMAEQMYAISLIGEAEGGAYAEKADKINEYYQDVIDRVSADASKISDSDRITVYHSINEAVRTDSDNSLGYDWITTCGCVDVSASHTADMTADGTDYCAGIEQIFAWDPDVVICNEASTKEYLLSDEKWAGLRAVRESKVYNIPVGATRWGQRGSLETFLAMIWLGTSLYPGYFNDFDLRTEVDHFYEDIIGIEVTDELYIKMLTGTGIRQSSSAAN